MMGECISATFMSEKDVFILDMHMNNYNMTQILLQSQLPG